MSQGQVSGSDPRSLGERLAQGRERAGLTQAKVAEQLRISVSIIAALEAGDYSSIGPQVFVRGYLRRFADLIGESPESIALATQQHSWGDPTSEITSTRLRPLAGTSDQRRIGLWPVLIVAFLLVAGAVVWWAQRAAAPRAAAAKPARAQQSLVQEVVVAPPTLADGAVAAAPGEGVAADAGGTPAPASAVAPAATPAASPVANPPAAAATAAAVAAAPTAPVKRGAPLAAPANRASPPTTRAAGPRRQLRLAFKGESWAEVYDAAGGRLYWDLGRGGQAQTLAGVPPFKITLGNPALVSLAIDGQPLQLPQPRVGTTLHLTIDGDGALESVR